MIFGQIMYVPSDLSKPSAIHAVSLGLEHRGAAQHRSKLFDNFVFLPEIFREIFALRARSVSYCPFRRNTASFIHALMYSILLYCLSSRTV